MRDFFIYLFFAALAVLILYPFLFRGNLMLSSDSDALYYYYPVFEFYGNALKSGDSFLWNPYIYSGFPTYLSQTGGFFDPINILLFRVFPSAFAYHLRLFIDLFLTMVFSYLAGRALGLSRLASSLIGMGYILAFHWRFLSNILIANTLFLMPFLLWTFLWAISAANFRRWFWAALGGAGLGLALLSGYTQVVFYALFLLGIFGVFYIIVFPRKKNALNNFATLGLILFVLCALGLLLGLPQVLPSLKYIPFSTREGGLDFAEAALKSIGPGDGILFFLPDYLYFPYLSAGRKPLYVGAFWFLMALAGLVLAKKRPLILGIAILFGFSFLTALEGSPIFYILQKLPIFQYFRFPFRWMYLGAFFLAVIGAYGFDTLRDFTASKILRQTFFIAGAVILGIVLLVLFFNLLDDAAAESAARFLDAIFYNLLYGNFGFTKDPAHYRDAILRGLNGWREFTSLGDVSFVVPFAALILGSALVFAFFLRRISWERFRVAGFVISLLTFIGIFAAQWGNSLPVEITEKHGRFLEDIIPARERGLYRTYPIFLADAFQKAAPPQFALSREEQMLLTELQFAAGRPNMHMYSGALSVAGYDPFIPRRLRDTFVEIGSVNAGESAEEEKILGNFDIMGMMGGKYIISGREISHHDLRFLARKEITRLKIPFYIYENKKALPRFYLTEDIEHPPASTAAVVEVLPKRLRNGYFEFQIVTGKPFWLVVSESFLPGWRAWLNGKEITIVRANGLYMAVDVPAGEHELTFKYEGIIGEAAVLRALGIIRQ